MGAINETVRNVNSTLRTMLMTVLVAGAGLGGYQAYDLINAPRRELQEKEAKLKAAEEQITELSGEVKRQSAEIDKLSASLKLLKVDQRIALLEVLEQTEAPGSETSRGVVTKVRFVETDPEGKLLGDSREFSVPGERIYVEYLVVKFDDAYVEKADLERGTAICLFQRLFGSGQTPDQGAQLDQPNTQPSAYAAGGVMSAFEKELWANFWELAHDAERMEKLGVRAMQGNAPFYRVRPGEEYRLELRTTGDFTMRNLNQPEDQPDLTSGASQ